MTAVLDPVAPATKAPFRGLIGSYFISEIGTATSAVAIPWLVLTTTGSATDTGLIGFAMMLPYVILQATAGPLVDRIGLRRTFLTGNLLAAGLVGAIPLLHALAALHIGVLAVIVAVAGGTRGLADTATAPLVPATAALGGIASERAAGSYSAANRSALLIGTPMSGVLISLIGAPSAVLIDAVSFALAAALFAQLVHVDAPPAEQITFAGYRRDLAEGFRFLRLDRLLFGLVIVTTLTNLFDEAFASVLLPVWVRNRLGEAAGLGLVGGTSAVGALLGVALGSWLGPRLPRHKTYSVAYLLCASPPFFALAAFSSLPPVLPIALLTGIAGGMLNPINGAVIFERIPARLQTRVIGSVRASAYLGIPFGSLLGGLLTGAAGVTSALVICGTAMLLATLTPFVFPAWKGLDRPVAGQAGRPDHI